MATEARRELDALDLLMQDHRELESLFSEFEYLQRTGKDTAAVIETACEELKIHDTLENDVFYPAVSDAADDESTEALLNDAEDAHDDVLDLIEQLELMLPDVAKRNAHFGVIVQHVNRHIQEEETQLFPKVKALEQLDLDAVATGMKARKGELMAESAPPEISAENV